MIDVVTSTPNALHMVSGPGISWTTANFSEAIPGVQTPLSLSFWVDASEASLVRMSVDLGAVSARDGYVDGNTDRRYMGMFYGRMVGNITRFRALADRLPGTSGDAFEEQIFGVVRSGEHSRPIRRRYPYIAVKMPLSAWRMPRAVLAARQANDDWWRQATATAADYPAASLAEAFRRFQLLIHAHGLVSMLAQACFERVAVLARLAGMGGAEAELVTGYGGMEETKLLADLWRTARGSMTMDAFLLQHGFHGPSSGDLLLPSWREDRASLESLLPVYRAMPDDQAPQRRQDAQVAARQKVEEELLAALPRLHRPAARLVLRLTSRFVVLREVGKTAYIQALDVARAASRALGTALAKDGVIEAPEDVFFLTRAELSGPLPADAASRVTERRAFYKVCQAVALPEYWTGMPTPIPVNEGLGKGSPEAIELHGLGITPGRVSGQVRVVHDPIAEPPLEPGEILVCATTNPAWVTLFLVAGALVIDVGGPLSHGAIAARELGIPCVINTREGTTLLRTGDHVVVDSDHGTVTTVGPREGALK